MDAFAQAAGAPLGGARDDRHVGLRPVHAGRLGRQGGDDRPADRLLLVVGDHLREDAPAADAEAQRPVLRGHVLVGRLARGSLRPRRRQARRSDVERLRRRHARMAPLGVQGPGDQRHGARGTAPAHRAGDERHHPARDGGDREAPGLPRHGRRQRHLRRPVRHGLGHHEQLRPHRAVEEHLARRGGAGHLRGAVRHRHRPGRRHPGGRRLQHPVGPGAALRHQLEAFAGEFITILSRQLEEQV